VNLDGVTITGGCLCESRPLEPDEPEDDFTSSVRHLMSRTPDPWHKNLSSSASGVVSKKRFAEIVMKISEAPGFIPTHAPCGDRADLGGESSLGAFLVGGIDDTKNYASFLAEVTAEVGGRTITQEAVITVRPLAAREVADRCRQA